MSTPSLDELLFQVNHDTVEPVSYSRVSTLGRIEPALRTMGLPTFAVVVVCIVLGMLRAPTL
jgi:hypothetical protein